MFENEELYEKYDLLLPSKFDGGYLIISLYEKIKSKEINEQFTITEIRNILDEISIKYQQSTTQPERLLKKLLHYFLRNLVDDPGKYHLTDYAKNMVELIKNKLENPYKNFPLKESFEKSFSVRFNKVRDINELEGKFGRIFIEGPKKVINDHLEALEDELKEAYIELNTILKFDEEDATTLVKKFVIVFRKFGDRAIDITNSISSKDRFLHTLRGYVDEFYTMCEKYKQPETQEEVAALTNLKNDWERSTEIYHDIEIFFKTIDYKINNIRKQIINASEKLSELHEHFSTRSYFRLQIKRLLKLMLDNASFNEAGASFENNFPLKELVYERLRFFYPDYYDFQIEKPNFIITIPYDHEYEQQERCEIEKEVKRQQIINVWIVKLKIILEKGESVLLSDLMETIIQKESDFSIAYHVAAEIIQYVAENSNYQICIEQILIPLKNKDVSLWKTSLKRIQTIHS